MITYTVIKNDTLSQIAYRYQTTVAILLSDNPTITNKNKIYPGQKIKVRTSQEYAKAKADAAKKAAEEAKKTPGASSPPNVLPKDTPVTYIGNVTMIRNANLYKLNSNGNLTVQRAVKKNDSYKAYGVSDKNGGLYLLGGAYAKKADVKFVPLANLPTKPPATNTDNSTKNPITSTKKLKDFEIANFTYPGYRRMRMKVTSRDGKAIALELRAQAFNAGYSNQITPSRTNEGWAVHIGGRNLSVLQINGFVLDTAGNREADDFLRNYHDYLTPRSNANHFSSALVTLLHKDREYKGLINAMNLSEQSDNPLDRKFSMQFLVLTEKSLNGEGITGTSGLLIDRKKQFEPDFFSDLNNMLKNPITGK